MLWCGESCTLGTGFGTYSLELLRRLHDSGKYDLMEYASYARDGERTPWKRMGAGGRPEDPASQFGGENFEAACLAHRPDAVLDVRDHWYMRHELTSPFRRLYRLAWMPTVDAAGQRDEWLADYRAVDALFTYSDWAGGVLRREGGLETLGSAPAGADYGTFAPAPDKRAHKDRMGLRPDCLVVGTTMRNQKRKLYPDLFDGFARVLAAAPPELAGRCYLWCHTGWPDMGWDIPALLREHRLGAKVLFTYHCRACGAVEPAFFQGARRHCRACGAHASVLPGSQSGVRRDQLADVYNAFDVYVQYANSEGLGMPQIEAAACGVPVVSVDYSAMSDVVRKVRGTPVPVLALTREVETGCLRAVPDNAAFAALLARLLALPEAARARAGMAAAVAAREHYDWDRTAGRWMGWLDSLPAGGPDQWDEPPRAHRPAAESDAPAGAPDSAFVAWALAHVAGRPELSRSHLAARLTRDLEWGATLLGGALDDDLSALGARPRVREFGRREVVGVCSDMARRDAEWEGRRAGGRAE